MPDPEKENSHEYTRQVKSTHNDQEFDSFNRSNKEKLETKTTDNQSINESSIDSPNIDLLIEDLLSKLFASSLNGETFVDPEINKFLNDFIRQIQIERYFQSE